MQTRHVYLIGTGFIARTHAQVIRDRLTEHNLQIHATDRNRDALNAFVAEFPTAQGYPDAATMLARKVHRGDVVIVCTPPVSHFELSLQALDSGRNVLCEKPLAMTVEEATLMLAQARRSGLLLGCCSSRYTGRPGAAQVRDAVQSSKLGKLYRVRWISRQRRGRTGIDYLPETMAWAYSKEVNGGGIVMDWAPYDFAVLNEVLQPQEVRIEHAVLATPEAASQNSDHLDVDVEFHAIVRMRYLLPGGQEVSVDYERGSCLHGPEQRSFEFEGEEQTIGYDWQRKGAVTSFIDRRGSPQEITTIPTENPPLSPLARPLTYFIRAVNHVNSPAVLNENAVFNFACVRGIYECAESRSAVTIRRPSSMESESLFTEPEKIVWREVEPV